MQHKFSGLGVAMVTPFNSDDTVDFAGLAKLTEYLIAGGVDYLVVQGTTGESATLTKDEKVDVLEHVKDVNQGRLPIVFGHGGNNTAELVKGFSRYDFEGVDAILSASPYYNKPTQEGIYQHYKALSEASPVPIILYNVPGRTASNIAPQTTVRLAKDFDNIIAIKEASGNLGQISQIIKNRPVGFAVISGDDPLVVPHISIGGEGVISVIANATPRVFSKMVKDALIGDFNSAAKTHIRVLDLIDLLFVDGNPGGIKAALQLKEVCKDYLRLPLVAISNETREAIAKELIGLD